ncbi:MAG: adenylate kinase family protein [Methanobacteriota archaeon]
MIVAITGTPGTGKSAVAEVLAARGHRVVDLSDLIARTGIAAEIDEERGSLLVDPLVLETEVSLLLSRLPDADGPVFLEGHLSHLLSQVDEVCVLRCQPKELALRLGAREWAAAKIRENVEAEALDVIAVECADRPRAFELDTTDASPDETADRLLAILEGDEDARAGARLGSVAWLSEFLEDPPEVEGAPELEEDEEAW